MLISCHESLLSGVQLEYHVRDLRGEIIKEMKEAVRLTHSGLKVVALKDSDNPGVPSRTVQDCKKAQDLLAGDSLHINVPFLVALQPHTNEGVSTSTRRLGSDPYLTGGLASPLLVSDMVSELWLLRVQSAPHCQLLHMSESSEESTPQCQLAQLCLSSVHTEADCSRSILESGPTGAVNVALPSHFLCTQRVCHCCPLGRCPCAKTLELTTCRQTCP